MDDDEDSFLYGDSVQTIPQSPVQKTALTVNAEIIPVFEENEKHDSIADTPVEIQPKADTKMQDEEGILNNQDPAESENAGEGDGEDGEEMDEDAEESDDDIEFIMEPPSRSLDFRGQRGGHRPTQLRTSSTGTPSTPAHTHPTNLTTEYTPRERGVSSTEPLQRSSSQILPTPQDGILKVQAITSIPRSTSSQQPGIDDGPDPSTLPPVRAPPSHPSIDPTIPGMADGRSVFEIDMTNLAEKPWRRPGSDISDWFNYGFDEISWEAYCYRRRDIGELASVMKANVINFAGMQEEQLLALPPEVRTMVMTGTNAMMGVAAGGPGPGPGPGPVVGVPVGPGMLPPNMNPMNPMNSMPPMNAMNPMMTDMGQMGGIGPMTVGMGPMGMGMGGDIGVGMPGSTPGPGGMLQDNTTPGAMQGPVVVPNAPVQNVGPEQSGQLPMPDGMLGANSGILGVNMGGDFPMPDGSAMSNHQMFSGIEGSSSPSPIQAGRGTPIPMQFRGRGVALGPRGRATVFPTRGRGRGGAFETIAPQLPVRPASPLPPNVPTGPRNPGRYKDRDNNTPAVDGLDYGGNKDGKDGNNGTPSVDREQDEKASKKRRSPPVTEDDRMGRSAKRR